MAEDRNGSHENDTSAIWGWTELFRTFQVALDPKKLVLAAAGIVTMYFGWLFLSWLFFSARSEPVGADFQATSYEQKSIADETERRADSERRAKEAFEAAHLRYRKFYALAAPGDPDAVEPWKRPQGLFRAAPWHENRGPNPFLLATGQHGRPWDAGHFLDWIFTEQMPVLVEPLVKLLRPILLLLSPLADGWNRIYLLFITFWTLLTWGLFGGAITRLAAVQLAGKDRPGLMEAVRFVTSRYLSYLSAPMVPLIFVAIIVVFGVLFGLIHLIPIVGDLADSIAWPFLILLGFGQTVLLIGMVGYPLMYATISAEGSDTFDALSRSYNYVFQSPWNYIWYSFVAIAYGAVLVFFVGFVGSMVVYLTKWSVAQTPGTEYFTSRRVDNLFLFAPTTYEWNRLLVSQPDLLGDEAARTVYKHSHFYWWNYVSSFVVSFWMILMLLIVVGFGYSYYFTAFTQIYFLMRRKVDDVEMDEVYLEEDEPDEPSLPPPPVAPPPPSGPPGGTSLPMVDATKPAAADGTAPTNTP